MLDGAAADAGSARARKLDAVPTVAAKKQITLDGEAVTIGKGLVGGGGGIVGASYADHIPQPAITTRPTLGRRWTISARCHRGMGTTGPAKHRILRGLCQGSSWSQTAILYGSGECQCGYAQGEGVGHVAGAVVGDEAHT